MSKNIYLSELDYQRFGVQTVQARDLSEEERAILARFCEENAAQLSIVRVDINNLAVVQALEEEGYRLMDTLVYYAFKFDKKAIPTDSNTHKIRPIAGQDLEAVIRIAQESFKGYYGHYHADSRLAKDKCDEVYVDWAAKSVSSRDVADDVLVVVGEGRLNGFATLRMNNPQEGEGVLFGVAPYAQGQGIYQSMMIGGMKWVQERGAKQMVVSTQINNLAVQKVWARLGFEMHKAYYTLHKWF
jgi:ribosomal protein S18 acetylase RimI-like enzyme